VIPWEQLDKVAVPGGDDLRLMRRGTEYAIKLGTNELMTSRLSGSEKALASLACARMPPGARPELLIGGLGMGFTLRQALRVLGPDARILVVELIPAVVAWARGPLAALFEDCLDDPRVTLAIGDVGATMRDARRRFSAILLDVDNGPEALTTEGNDWLYGPAGLGAAAAALRAGGVLAIWSCAPDAAFVKRLSRAGFAVEEERVRAHGSGGARHVIWLAKRQ